MQIILCVSGSESGQSLDVTVSECLSSDCVADKYNFAILLLLRKAARICDHNIKRNTENRLMCPCKLRGKAWIDELFELCKLSTASVLS